MSRPMTITEKILAAHAGKDQVEPGEIINARVDLVMMNELSGIVSIEAFDKIKGATRVFDPTKIVLVPDHFAPAKDIQSSFMIQLLRDFASKHGTLFFDVGRAGIEHVLLPEKGLVGPGYVVAGGDSHSCTYGALGAFSTGFGSTDIAAAMALGEVWLKVPTSLKFVYHGRPRPGVVGKDFMLYTIGQVGVDGATYRAMEFVGEAIGALSVSDRLTMANMAIEAGAKSGIFHVDEKTLDYVRQAGGQVLGVYASDPDAEYERVYEFDGSAIEPQVAFPHLPENTRPISQVGEVWIDQVFIGSCTNGKIDDLRIAAEILRGRKINPRVRTIITPATQQVYLEASREGLLADFVEAGCVVTAPSCGACIGGHQGVIGEGERCLSTTNRNFVGRMGHPKSEVYLAGPAVAAATAIVGRIASPEEVLSPREAVAR